MNLFVKDARAQARGFRSGVWMLALASLLAMSGCGDDAFDTHDTRENNSVLFSPLRTQSAVPTVVQDPDAPSDDGIEEIQAIVAEFESGMMADGASAQGLPSMVDLESQFIQRGRYLDLVGIYQNMVKKDTLQSEIKDEQPSGATATSAIELRLARAYLRLGQDRLARELLDKMIVQDPDSPMTWFLNAAYWLPEAGESEEAGAQVVANWQKTFDIDPNFVGFDQANAPSIKEQLAVLRQRVPEDKIAEATAALHKKINADASEKTTKDSADTKPTQKIADAQAPGTHNNEIVEEGAPPKEDMPQEPETTVKSDDSTPQKTDSSPQNTPAPKKSPEEGEQPQRIPYMMAHANMALAQEKPGRAMKLFKQILARDADHFGAQFGQIRAGWIDPNLRPELEENLRQLAKRSDLKPREELEIGRFAYYNLEDADLALKLWTRVKKRAPKLAKTVGLDGLIEAAKQPADSD